MYLQVLQMLPNCFPIKFIAFSYNGFHSEILHSNETNIDKSKKHEIS